MIKDTNPDHFKVDGANFIEYMNDPKISGFGDWMFANGFNSGVWASTNWISVKDRLPERDGEYMVYGQSEAMRELLPDNAPIWICYYCKEHGFYNIEMRREYDYITHWMPLPEPPKEATGDD